MGKNTTTLERCTAAVKQNPLALEHVPVDIMSKELCLLAVEQNGLALKYIPNKMKDKELCTTAVNNNAMALKYVPSNRKIKSLCTTAVENNVLALEYVPNRFIGAIIEGFPKKVHNDNRIIKIERQLKVRFVKEKLFDNSTNKFITKELIFSREEIREFGSFIEFSEYLEGNLEGADLTGFDFDGINLKDFNIEGAYINSSALIVQNLYDDSFYAKNIRSDGSNLDLTLSAKNELVEASAIHHESNFNAPQTLNDSSRKIYYISDIHLNHKLINEFPSHATEMEVTLYIKKLITKMLTTATDRAYDDYLLIAGDISFNFEISKLFYTELVKQWREWDFLHNIVVVLGNHELWNFNQMGKPLVQKKKLDEIFQQYRDLFDSLGIYFLQNDLLILTERKDIIITEEQLKSIESAELKNICLESSLTILGGLGFSGLNHDFNASHEIYRSAIKSLDEDIKQTEKFEFFYKKVNDAIGGNQVIILTHTPKENWTNENYNSHWIYVNGHTHRNVYHIDGEKTVYADNQIGYYSSSIGLKHFYTSKNYDIFREYNDGIYIISREQYLDFNRGLRINMTFNRTNGEIHMLKNHGIYCFMFENTDLGKFYLLNGGAINKLEHDDINYYFKNMVYYSDAIKGLLNGYHQILKSISNSIKLIGGTGKIHGSIVDIDFSNHILVKPEDGTITPYFALSTIEKYEYEDVGALLLEQREDLYENYMQLLTERNKDIKLLASEINAESDEILRFNPDTYMYKVSRVMRALQYLTDVNVIRVWNDEVIEMQQQTEDMPQIENDHLRLP